MPFGAGAPPERPWKPWVAYALIAANVAVFLLELAVTLNVMGPTPEQMISLGGNLGILSRSGEPWRIFTAMFLHYGPIHLGMNMVCLYQISVVERMLGRAEFLALYLAAGLVGGVASAVIHPYAVSAGASGAVFGMFGAFTSVLWVRREQIGRVAYGRTMRSLGTFFLLNAVLGAAQSGIDLSAHVGGLIAGLVGGLALAASEPKVRGHFVRAASVAVVGTMAAFGGLALAPR
jgi:rhomboid protease GluP